MRQATDSRRPTRKVVRHPRGLARLSILGALVFVISSPWTMATRAGAEPFGVSDHNPTFSDRGWVSYELTRAELAAASMCGANQPLDSQSCYTGVHRFCTERGHVSGFAFEANGNPNQVEISCLGPASGTVFRQIPHDTWDDYLPACVHPVPSFHCGVAIDRYCRSEHGYAAGFGPVERNATISSVVCLRPEAAQSGPTPRVGTLLTDCSPTTATSSSCRRAMNDHCTGLTDGDGSSLNLRGGFGPGEMSTSVIRVPCVEEQLPWQANADQPLPPALPIDLLDRKIKSTGNPAAIGKVYEPILQHHALQPNRGMSIDGRLFARPTGPETPTKMMRFMIQTPELFSEPLSTQPVANKDRSDAVGIYTIPPDAPDPNSNIVTRLPLDSFHTHIDPMLGKVDAKSTALCDPHSPRALGAGHLSPPNTLNHQQAVPARTSNPASCTSQGVIDPIGDHDCYTVSVVTVYNKWNNPGNHKEGFQSEIWVTPVEVVVKNPKRHFRNGGPRDFNQRPHVVLVTAGSPAMVPALAGNPTGVLEPTITGDGRVIVVQGDGEIRYSVLADPENGPPLNACDPTGWTSFKHLYEMHQDPRMAGYGIAKYPLRDTEGNLIDPDLTSEGAVRGAYPWIDRDGDNLMFMQGRATLSYVDDGGTVRQRFEVLSHPVLGQETGDSEIPLVPASAAQLEQEFTKNQTDHLPRLGMTFVGLWSQGKMILPDTRNNAVDMGIPGGPAYHRMIDLYDEPEPAVGVEVGATIRTQINSLENRFFAHPRLRPDTPREVVWFLSSQSQTDEMAFDDVLDPKALIISSMMTTVRSTGIGSGEFQDGFEHLPSNIGRIRSGKGFVRPAHIANEATSVSQAVADNADPRFDLSANVQWNVPSYGYVLGGTRSEPVAAGGYKGRGIWLDGVDDRLEYLIPDQPASTVAEFQNTPWFVHVAFEPRDLSSRRRLLTLPDHTWVDIVDANRIAYGSITEFGGTLTLGPELTLAADTWSTFAVVAEPTQGGSQTLHFYLDGYLLASHTLSGKEFFRMRTGVVRLGAVDGGFRGWLDDFKIIARAPGPEVICNHSRGTIVSVWQNQPLEALADAFPNDSHAWLKTFLPSDNSDTKFACERPIDDPTDIYDAADSSHYLCLGKTRRPADQSSPSQCLREPLLLYPFHQTVEWDQPRPSFLATPFCGTCHVNSHPSATMTASDALAPGSTDAYLDIRRQPMQAPPEIFGTVPALYFGFTPITTFQTSEDGDPLDPLIDP